MVNFGYLAAVNVSSILADAGETILIGIVVVFSVLILLTLVFKVFGLVASAGTKKKAKPSDTQPAKAAPAPAVQSGIGDEVVAAIAAAVAAAMSDEGTTYTVRRIVRSQKGSRSAWAAAGVADNTQSF